MKMAKVYIVTSYDNIDEPVATRVSFSKSEAERLKERLADWRNVAYACVYERFAVLSELEIVDVGPVEAADAEGKEAEEDETV